MSYDGRAPRIGPTHFMDSDGKGVGQCRAASWLPAGATYRSHDTAPIIDKNTFTPRKVTGNREVVMEILTVNPAG